MQILDMSSGGPSKHQLLVPGNTKKRPNSSPVKRFKALLNFVCYCPKSIWAAREQVDMLIRSVWQNGFGEL